MNCGVPLGSDDERLLQQQDSSECHRAEEQVRWQCKLAKSIFYLCFIIFLLFFMNFVGEACG